MPVRCGRSLLGDEVTTQTKALETNLREVLGPERYGIVEGQLGTIGTDTVRRALNLDAAQNPQQLAVWVLDINGKPTVGCGWQGNGGAFTYYVGPLESFIADSTASGLDPAEVISTRALSGVLTSKIRDWAQQQAASLPAQELDK